MKKLTQDEFLKKAVSVHGDRYGYSFVDYKNSTTPIRIECRVHGEFLQSPNRHLYSGGCNKCRYIASAAKRRKSKDDFANESICVHGGVYDYSKTEYKSSHEKVSITCMSHGEFRITPHSHLKGQGCPSCGALKRIDTRHSGGYKRFVDKANDVHGDRYEYPIFEYRGNRRKTKIVCRVHGEFEQSIGDHLAGCGCPSCSSTTFDRRSNAFLYVLKSCSCFKIGITGNIKARFKKLRCETPFKFNVAAVFHGAGNVVYDMEKSLHMIFKNSGLRNFDGATEWFDIEGGFMEKIESKCLAKNLVEIEQ